MDNRYRDESDLHHANPILAVVVFAMTLATAPLTQAGPHGATAGPVQSDVAARLDHQPCSTPITEEICETRAFMTLAGPSAQDSLALLPRTTAESTRPSTGG